MCYFLEYYTPVETHKTNSLETTASWDDWVPQDRIRKNSDENKELAANLKSELDRMTRPAKAAASSTKKKAPGSDLSSTRGSEERLTPATGRGQKRVRDNEIEKVGPPSPKRISTRVKKPTEKFSSMAPPEKPTPKASPPEKVAKAEPAAPKKEPNALKRSRTPAKPMEPPAKKQRVTRSSAPEGPVTSGATSRKRPDGYFVSAGVSLEPKTDKHRINQQEETFNSRPAVHIPTPDNLKALLVDDWEYVTKNLTLIPLPAEHPVNEIVDAYFEEEKPKRRYGSADMDILQEVVSGLKEYFEKTLGRILLYRFERQQYLEVYMKMQANEGEFENKTIGDIYGAEHLARLLGMFVPSLPPTLA